MSARPQRAAKQRALQILLQEEPVASEDSSSDEGVEDNDVAFQRQGDSPSETDSEVEVPPDLDEDVLFEDEVEDLLSSSESELSEAEEEQVAYEPASLLAPNGVQWQLTRPAVGREPRANIFTGRRGFISARSASIKRIWSIPVFVRRATTTSNSVHQQEWKAVGEYEWYDVEGRRQRRNDGICW